MSVRGLTPEARFMFDAVRVADLGRRAPAKTPDDAVDWLALGRLAEREKLLSVLWPSLSTGSTDVPDSVAAAFRRQTAVTEFRMAALEAHLRRIVRLLAEHGIPVMLLKGSAMALTVYGSFRRRPMGDIDLVVREAQAQAAWSLLRDAGWRREYADGDAFYDDLQHLCPLVSPGGANIVVEVHRSLLYPQGPFRLSEERVWGAAIPVDVGGCTAYVPAPVHQVLHMCVHFAWAHSMARGLARTVRDLGALIDSYDIDGSLLLELARETQSVSCCYWTLRLARNLGGADVPARLLAALTPATPRFLRDALERIVVAMALDPYETFSPSLWLRRRVWERAVRPEESGHGDVRPWTAHAGWADVVSSPAPPSLVRRLAGQVARLPQWLRFMRVLVGAGAPPAAR